MMPGFITIHSIKQAFPVQQQLQAFYTKSVNVWFLEMQNVRGKVISTKFQAPFSFQGC